MIVYFVKQSIFSSISVCCICLRMPPIFTTGLKSLVCCTSLIFFFFFQAEDGIRDWSVTGVQTCALPISSATELRRFRVHSLFQPPGGTMLPFFRALRFFSTLLLVCSIPLRAQDMPLRVEIGRASCRERV